MPAAQAQATLAALAWVQQADAERQQLQRVIGQFQQGAQALGLALMPSQTAIQPLVVGQSTAAVAMANRLRELGCWVSAIRPPTVPVGSARLRITLTAAHSESDVERLLAALTQCMSPVPGSGG